MTGEELDKVRGAVWQFNEAVSMLREARESLSDGLDLAGEIDEGLPEVQSALEWVAGWLAGQQADVTGNPAYVVFSESPTSGKGVLVTQDLDDAIAEIANRLRSEPHLKITAWRANG